MHQAGTTTPSSQRVRQSSEPNHNNGHGGGSGHTNNGHSNYSYNNNNANSSSSSSFPQQPLPHLRQRHATVGGDNNHAGHAKRRADLLATATPPPHSLPSDEDLTAFMAKWAPGGGGGGGETSTTSYLLQPVEVDSPIYSTSSSRLLSIGSYSSQRHISTQDSHDSAETTYYHSSGGGGVGSSNLNMNPHLSSSCHFYPHQQHGSSSSSFNTNTNNMSSSSSTVSSVIHDAARITDWDLVLELCETVPEAASYKGRDGWTALHHACNKRCPRPDVISALLQVYPEALLQEEEKSWLPLHYACRFKAPREIVKLLLHTVPDSGRIAISRRDKQGRKPLYYAIRYDAPPGVAGLLISLDPSAVLDEDQNEDSPLALVWDSWAEKLEGKRIVHSFLPGGFTTTTTTTTVPPVAAAAAVTVPPLQQQDHDHLVAAASASAGSTSPALTPEQTAEILRQRLDKEPKLKKRWNQVNMLLRAAFGFPYEEDNNYAKQDVTLSSSFDDGGMIMIGGSDHGLSSAEAAAAASASFVTTTTTNRVWRIVHATAAVKCHLSLFRLACALHPEQARELDENDLCYQRHKPSKAMTVAASSSSPLPQPRTTHQTALHLAASSNAGGEPGKTVIYTLLSLYREAAEIADEIDGSLPLHRMVENPRKQDWPNHAAIIYHFYERAVQIPDAHGKLPLHRAAAGITHEDHGENDPEDHSVIIQLVRAFPQAAAHVDQDHCLPLHYLCRHAKVWDGDVEAVYHNHRQAITVRGGGSNCQQLPLHMAAQNPMAAESMIQRIVSLHPRGASMEDGQGDLPLHLACRIGKRWEDGTRLIYEAFPAAVSTMERQRRRPNGTDVRQQHQQPPQRGWYPLHMATAAWESTGELIDKLVELFPEASTIPDVNGRYPFHLACTRGKSWNGGLRSLFDANPSALSQCDNFGLLPLHICALAYCHKSDDVVDDTSKIKLTPKLEAEKEISESSAEAAELDILFNIIRADPTTIASK